jgi:prevent-host-death family protein
MKTKTISAAEFKAKCLAILDNVGQEGIVITKHGKAVAKLVPYTSQSSQLLGCLRGKLLVRGDSLATDLEWDAES